MDTMKCGACGVENPKSRATCLVCHEPLRKETKEKPETEKGKPEPAPETEKNKPEPVSKTDKMDSQQSKPKTQKPDPFLDRKKDAPVAIKINPNTVPPKPKVKRKRRNKSAAEAQYFKLEDDGLVPVEVQVRIHPLKKKDIGPIPASLIDLWNRNKSLLK